MFALAFASPSARAQNGVGPGPAPSATPVPTQINSDISSGEQVLNLGSNFLERLVNEATGGFNHGLQRNPGGGGASQAVEAPRYRSFGEVYGLSVTTDPQGAFFGDKRRILGGVVGVGAHLWPGVNVGFSVDQSHTQVDVPLALQSAAIDLTQLGFTASWTRDHGAGRSHWCTALAISARAATPGSASRWRAMATGSMAR